jgi:hypothetical protein
VDYRQPVYDIDDSGRSIGRATPAGITGNGTARSSCFTCQRRVALHEQMLGCRNDREEIKRTRIHAVSAGCTEIGIDLRETLPVHGNCVERTGDLAVAQSKTAPGTCPTAAVDNDRALAGRDAFVSGEIRDQALSSCTLEACHALLVTAHVYTQESGDLDEGFCGADRAFSGRDLAFDEAAGEGLASRLAARSTVISGQQGFNFLKPRILFDPEEMIRRSQNGSEDHAQPGHDNCSRNHRFHVDLLQAFLLKGFRSFHEFRRCSRISGTGLTGVDATRGTGFRRPYQFSESALRRVRYVRLTVIVVLEHS